MNPKYLNFFGLLARSPQLALTFLHCGWDL